MENSVERAEKVKINIPYTYEITVFLVGFLGLQGISILFALIYRLSMDVEGVNFAVATNCSTYGATLLCLIAVLIPVIKKILPVFKDYRGYIAGVAGFVAMIVLENIYGNLISLVPGYTQSENELDIREMITNYPILMCFTVCIFAPLVEETTYRLGLFSFIKRKNRILAYIVTILVFTFIHFSYDAENIGNEFLNVPGYMIGAFVLTFTYDYFGYHASITAHSINNLFVFVVTLISKE